MKSIRSGSGLGDSIYLQSAVRHLVERGENLEVCSDWPEVFIPLDGAVKVSPFRRDVDIRAHYAMRKGAHGSDQFEDVCIAAGIARGPVPFTLGWRPVNRKLIERVRAGNRPVVVVQLPRRPFDRKDGFGAELLPDCEVIQRAIDMISGRATIVQIGKGDALYRFDGIDIDLANRTSVSDLLDIASAADGFLGYVSFLVPLAESLGKPALLVWSRRGLESRHEFIRQITPEKIFHCAVTKYVTDDCTEQALAWSVDGLCAEIGRSPPLPRQDCRDRGLRAGSA